MNTDSELSKQLSEKTDQPAAAPPPVEPRGSALPSLRKWLAGLLFIGVLVMISLGGWRWWLRSLPMPPSVESSDPEIAEIIAEARQDVVHKPWSGPAWGYYGMVLMAHDYAKEAIFCLEQAERFDPHDARWPYFQGLNLLVTKRDHPDEGILCLKRAAERCGDVPLAPRIRLAEALLDAGRLDDASQSLQKALNADPNNPRVHLLLSNLAMKRSDWKTAIEHVDVCLQDERFKKPALALRAEAYRKLGMSARAAADEQQARKLPDPELPPDPYADQVYHLERGLPARLKTCVTLRKKQQFDQAIAILEDTGRKYPDSALPWLNLGDLYMEHGQLKQAGEACRKAVQADPKATQGWYGIGYAEMATDPKEAVEKFNRVLHLKPDHYLAHYNLGLCLWRLGDFASAKAEFESALRTQVDYEPARKALKELLQKKSPAEKQGTKE